MQKSDIIFTVALRSDKSRTLNQVRKELDLILKEEYSIDVERWDKNIDGPIADGLIQHMTSHGQSISIKSLVREIDMILQRIS